MLKKLVIILLLASIFVWTSPVHAGFGISPPYVKPDKAIMAGSRYEQQITLLRSSADADMVAEVKVNAPEISDWISIDKGLEFDLPKDAQSVNMVVVVDVPTDAEIGNYKGYLNVRIAPKEDSNSGGVAIALGARVDIDITITNETFVDFIVRRVDIPTIEVLKAPWKWPMFSWFFYRVKVDMLIENTGNTRIAPSKVKIDIYDIAKKNLLESHIDKRIDKIEPFVTGDVSATFPTKLGPGEYWGKISIYKDNDIIQKNEIIFKINPEGKTPEGVNLGKWPYILFSAYVLLILIFLYILIRVKIWKQLYLIFLILTWPIRFIFKKLIQLKNVLQKKFWSYMHKKAAKYSNEDIEEKEKE
ncbi:hypothetical protein C0583_04840 [Candidatus Parcubacteria bacterium]|nr:MAG: hypothetical protein C0583_04840 [Candidatus Parcubacteria bacterium]